jgi:hypothetical protein
MSFIHQTAVKLIMDTNGDVLLRLMDIAMIESGKVSWNRTKRMMSALAGGIHEERSVYP